MRRIRSIACIIFLCWSFAACATSAPWATKDAHKQLSIKAGELADIWGQLAKESFQLKAYDDVIAAADHALAVYADHVPSLLVRSRAYTEKNLYKQAYNDLRRVVDLDARVEHKRMLAEAALKAGVYDDATTLLQELILADPKDKNLRFNYGLLLLEQKQGAEALEVFVELHEVGDKVVGQLVEAAREAKDPRYISYLELAVSTNQKLSDKKKYQLELFDYYDKESRIEDAKLLWDEILKAKYEKADALKLLSFGFAHDPLWAIDKLKEALTKKVLTPKHRKDIEKAMPQDFDEAYKMAIDEMLKNVEKGKPIKAAPVEPKVPASAAPKAEVPASKAAETK